MIKELYKLFIEYCAQFTETEVDFQLRLFDDGMGRLMKVEYMMRDDDNTRCLLDWDSIEEGIELLKKELENAIPRL